MNKFIYIESEKHFHEQRAKGIGSSDIPVLAGLYTHWDKTPVTLWMEKTGRAEPFQGNEKTKWGKHLEPLVLREFLHNRGKFKTGNIMAECHAKQKPYSRNGIEILTSCQHPDFNYCIAHADMINTRGDNIITCPKCGARDEYSPGVSLPCSNDCGLIISAPKDPLPYIVEAKTTGFYAGKRHEKNDFGWSKENKDESGIPAAVYLQIQFQMFVYDIPAAWVPVLIDTSDYSEYGIIKANKSIQEKILAMVTNFWDCIQKDKPPKPIIFKDLNLLFPNQTKTTKIISGTELDNVITMKEEKKHLEEINKKNDKKIDEIKTAIGAILGNDQILGTPEGKTLGKISTIDGRKTITKLSEIENKFPDLYKTLDDNGYIKQGESYKRLNF